MIVLDYSDQATGTMVVQRDGRGHFAEVTLNPIVTVSELSMVTKAFELHHRAGEFCFIANAVNFPVNHEPKINTI